MPSNPSLPSLEIGSTLSHFELLEVLGEGGMGIVFRAQDTIIRRQVALKVMQPHLAKQLKSKERFLREARTAAHVEHDRIVRIHEVNEDRGIPYIAMELLRGQSLDKKLRENPNLPLSFIFRVIRQVAEGLAVAHEKGLIHRDIKPSNIWLEPYEGSFRCKILDFGLARAAEGDSISTKSGQMMGTPSYMSPEQWKGKEIDSRTDLYSLGVMLYQMTTGKAPFESDSHANLMYQVLMEDPKSPLELNPRIPSALGDLIRQLMAKEKTERPTKAPEIIRSLDKISKQVTEIARDLSATPPEAVVVTDTRTARHSDTYRSRRELDRSRRDQDRSEVFQTAVLPPDSQRASRTWLPWLGMFVGLVVGIVGIVLATTKQTPPDRTVEITQLLTEKIQLEERFKQLEKEYSGIGKKTPQEIEEERKRLSEYASLLKEKQKLEGDLNQLQTKLEEEQKSAANQKSELGKTIEKQKEDLARWGEEKQKSEEKLQFLENKVKDYLTRINEADRREQRRKSEFDQLTYEKGKLESDIKLLQLKVTLLEIQNKSDDRQIVKKPDPLDCTGAKGADDKAVQLSQKAWADYLGVPVETSVDLGDGVKMEFVLIPPGKYQMGATKEEHDEYAKTLKEGEKRTEFLDWELPLHDVTITKPFYICKYEVTQQEYTTLTKFKNPSWFSESGTGKDKVKDLNTKRFPVESVSWQEAMKCGELLAKQKLPNKVKAVSLPTEAQWEYACRAGSRTPFHFGNILNGRQANHCGNLPFGTTTTGPYLTRPEVVDSKSYLVNGFGLSNMHGNVWEWCLDGFDAQAYTKHQKEDPVFDNSTTRRAMRGGAWNYHGWGCRSAHRYFGETNLHDELVGFRLVLLFDDTPVLKFPPQNQVSQIKEKPKKPNPLDCTGAKGADERTVQAAQKAWANYLGIKVEETVELGDGVKMEFVLIPPGKYLMGGTKEEHDEYMKALNEGEKRPERLDWELPQHEVTISKPFYMAKYEVTQQEYTTLTKLKNPSAFTKGGENQEKVQDKNTDRHPVENVKWADGVLYAESLSKQKLPKRVKKASLPTEAQWEYACRAGSRTIFHFGNILNGNQANCDGNFPFGTTLTGPKAESTVPVDSNEFKPNPFGLHHMHGNVWEWCLDGFQAQAYENHKNPDPFTENADKPLIVRGGSWYCISPVCRSASRYPFEATHYYGDLGFRMVLLFEDE